MWLSDRSSRSPSRVSSPRRIALLGALLAAATACQGPDGSGRVVAHFTTLECKGGDAADLAGYGFDAQYLATDRFSGTLLISILKYRVNIEETDGLVIRLSLKRLLAQKALTVDPNGRIVRA